MGHHVKFNQEGYIRALQRALYSAMEKVEKEVFNAIVRNFGALQFRELDVKYVSDMRRAIRYATTRTIESIVSRFLAGYEPIPNQSFRLVYYEYGTGTKMRPPDNYSPSDDPYWNDARPRKIGEPIWTRPMSSWRDAGGNWHTSRNRGKPRPLPETSKYGRPIEANYWFREGFREGTVNLDKYVLDAVKSVPITSYISIANIYKRM